MVDSRASMHTVSRKDLNSAELETARVSKSPTTVVSAIGEVPTKGEATVYVRELDLCVTVMLLEDTPAVLSLGNSAKITGLITIGPKEAKVSNATWRPSYDSLSLVYRQSLSSSSSPTSPTSSSHEAVIPTEHPASTRSESKSEEVRGNS